MMIFIVPIFWPLLLLYAVVRFWKFTLPMTAMGVLYWLVTAHPWVGYPVLALTVVVVVWQLHLHQPIDQEEPSEWTHSI